MAIGEFGGAPKLLPGDGGILFAAPMYWFYEMNQAALNPSRAWADATKLMFKNPLNPLAATTFGKSVAAACELFERSTRRYGRPEWGIPTTMVGGEWVPAYRGGVERPFCRLLHFGAGRSITGRTARSRASLIVAPMSGHYSTLLRGTVEAFLAEPRRLSPNGRTPAW
jgi:poly(3-hydroxybutyrate) depolymerase